jgi:hypothetical protein
MRLELILRAVDIRGQQYMAYFDPLTLLPALAAVTTHVGLCAIAAQISPGGDPTSARWVGSVIYRPPGSAACCHQLAGDRPGLI